MSEILAILVGGVAMFFIGLGVGNYVAKREQNETERLWRK